MLTQIGFWLLDSCRGYSQTEIRNLWFNLDVWVKDGCKCRRKWCASRFNEMQLNVMLLEENYEEMTSDTFHFSSRSLVLYRLTSETHPSLISSLLSSCFLHFIFFSHTHLSCFNSLWTLTCVWLFMASLWGKGGKIYSQRTRTSKGQMTSSSDLRLSKSSTVTCMLKS